MNPDDAPFRDRAAARVVLRHEADRAALARLLHDEATQTLANLALHIQLCERALAVDGERARSELATALQALGSAIDRLRARSFELRPTTIDEAGLVSALRRFLQALGPAGEHVEVVDETDGARLPAPLELALFRAAQEFLVGLPVAPAGTTSIRVWIRGNTAGIDLAGPTRSAPSASDWSDNLAADWAAALGGSLEASDGPEGRRLHLELVLQ